MNIHQLTKRGSNHDDYCEDYVFANKLNDNYIVAGVFDGCSTGIESHFASALFGKIVKKNCLKFDFSKYENTEEILKNIIYNTAFQIKKIALENDFEVNELLSTIIFLVIDISKNQGNIICIGDGFLSINGKNINIEQDNKPNYFAYNLFDFENFNDFEKWFENFENKFYFDEVIDITISTDGILSYIINKKLDEQMDLSEVVDFYTKDTTLKNNKSMLSRKANILKNIHGFEHFDDLGIVRIL